MTDVSAPPSAPGSLTSPPSQQETLTYLDALNHWSSDLKDALDALDATAQVANDPAAHTADIVLAMSLWSQIDARRQELDTAWDSGRVGNDELATIATLIWGRLKDPLGAPSAFTLPEACTLAAALQGRLQQVLASDAIGGSGAAPRLAPLRDAIERCLAQARVLGEPTTQIEQLSAELEAAVQGSEPRVIADTINRVDQAIALIERDLIKTASMRAGLAGQAAELRRRYDDLVKLAAEVTTLSRQCTEKIANAPRLGIPSVVSLGQPPTAPPADQPAMTQYAQRLGRCAAALTLAHDRFAQPLSEREDLRGLLGAYRNRANMSGLSEDAGLEEQYRQAHDVLWTAPCDLPAARVLVADYQKAVRIAVGAEPHKEETS